MNKIFPLETILSVTTGRLVTKSKGEDDNGIDSMYELLGHMTGDSPYTHSLGRFVEECKPVLLNKFPELNNANTDELDRLMDSRKLTNTSAEEVVREWVKMCVWNWGMSTEYSLTGNSVEHKYKNPLEELVEMRGRKQDG